MYIRQSTWNTKNEIAISIHPSFIVTEKYHIRLKDQTTRILIERIRANLNTIVPFSGGNATYQPVLSDNIRMLANCLTGKIKILSFNIPSTAIVRKDTFDIQQRIMTMTPNEKKRLGISKSGLWYQRKRLLERGTIKVYKNVLTKLNK